MAWLREGRFAALAGFDAAATRPLTNKAVKEIAAGLVVAKIDAVAKRATVAKLAETVAKIGKGKRGRPRVGDEPMSSAERMRRTRANRKAARRAPDKAEKR
jgi:hypothetical protein